MSERWAYSRDGEFYFGEFPSWRAAAEEGLFDYESVYVGEGITPRPAEEFIDGDDLIERVWNSDDEHYGGEWAEDWLKDATDEQKTELTTMVRAAFGAWLDKHGLRPKWYVIDRGVEVTREELDDPNFDPFTSNAKGA